VKRTFKGFTFFQTLILITLRLAHELPCNDLTREEFSMRDILFPILISLLTISSAQAITCSVDSQTTFTAFFSDKESGFYTEFMQSEMENYNTIVKTKRRPVQIPVLNVKATEFTHIGSKGAVFTYLSLNRKIYQPKLEINGETIELYNCL
jgi:hypothetical protein